MPKPRGSTTRSRIEDEADAWAESVRRRPSRSCETCRFLAAQPDAAAWLNRIVDRYLEGSITATIPQVHAQFVRLWPAYRMSSTALRNHIWHVREGRSRA